ncbi:MAG: hypothetical protein Q7S81_01175 [bacterium]|nr:hypothetical protein [bacterium]
MKYESKFEQTGNLFEWQFIGEVDINSREYQKELHKLQEEAAQKGASNGHIPYEEAMELARKFQPFDPTHPNKPFARDVRISLLDLMINKKLITDSEEDQDCIKFYTAVKTPLDTFHSVDAFIEFKDLKGKKYLTTFDLTLNPRKKEHRSDIIVTKLPDPNLDEDKLRYLATIEDYAQKALGVLEMRMAHEENKDE